MLEKLAKQTAIYGVSTILVRFLSYLLTPFYTRACSGRRLTASSRMSMR